jgi:hypothetical protein
MFKGFEINSMKKLPLAPAIIATVFISAPSVSASTIPVTMDN